ncbi:hypothetical protein TNIN_449351 [Trichonephila inaurata madagascariensis]|uniref:Uncharacterized protein n=1 Tax=Trichonephila inaurata madagascariensis TaxID=2747483 RepID=A0A8X7CRL0_9ARAC|nr:hypothetical protein TNIN_449351 [Trichonephila inaurata madagascariensis]
MNNTSRDKINTPSTSHNGDNQFYPSVSEDDHSKKKADPILPNLAAVLTKYDLELPKIKSKSICATHSQYDRLFRAMNCYPVSAELVEEEENRQSIFAECKIPEQSEDKKKNESVSAKGNKQTKPHYTEVYHGTFKRTQITSSVIVEDDEIEENRQSIFEVCELPQQSVTTKKEKSASAEETKQTELFCNDIYLGTFQLTNAQRASRLIRPTPTPVNSMSLSQTDIDPLTVEYSSTSTCKDSKTPNAQSCSQNDSSEKCAGDEFRSSSEFPCSSEHQNFPRYQLIFPPLRRSTSEPHAFHPQNRCIRVRSYLQTAAQFLWFNLGCRK